MLNLLADLQEHCGLTYVLVSHTLAVVARLCPVDGVMQGGVIVEIITRGALRAGQMQHRRTAELRALSTELEEA